MQNPVIILSAISSENSVSIDHNYQGKDNFRLMSGTNPVVGADIKIYRKKDYDLGLVSENNVIQRTVSRSDGRWEKQLQIPINGIYVLHISKKGVFKPMTKIVKV